MSDNTGQKDEGAVFDPENLKEADEDVIQSFQLESSGLRGRAVRLGAALDGVLSAHDYPYPVAHLVAETITLAAMLSSMLKYEGIFTLQAKGDGPVGMLVADMTSKGAIRGCASYDEERLQNAREQLAALKTPEGSSNHLAQYLGKGYIAFTVDQEGGKDRYQGIIDLRGASLVDCVQHYFTQSEQIATGIKMSVGLRDGKWRAGGIMLQKMPEEGGHTPRPGNMEEDDWRRAMILMDSCTDDEFLDEGLHSNALLFRLFHEEGVRVYKPLFVRKECRCSTEKVENILATLPADDIEYLTDDGRISMRCEFCSRDFIFDLDTVYRKLRGEPLPDTAGSS
ncbi:MAG: Hsp33 family molecular chaperone HslO [Alphaproteobacteria bacterium]|nr:Hsp33 family molecular chaperone HslO [Alphaproteobacteria bacterium]